MFHITSTLQQQQNICFAEAKEEPDMLRKREMSSNKKYMTFQELEAQRHKCESSRTSNGTPKLFSQSPVAKKLQQQILKTEEESPTTFKPPVEQSRRKRLQEQLQRHPHNAGLTPLAASLSKHQSSFSTPSPFKASHISSSTGRQATPKDHTLSSGMKRQPQSFSRLSVSVNQQSVRKQVSRTPPMLHSGKQATRKGAHRTPPLPTASKKPTPVRTPLSSLPNTPNETGPSTRRNLDKRTARLQYAQDFATQIDQIRDKITKESIHPALTNKDGISIYVRKRPIFTHEKENGDFDVVDVVAQNNVVVYKSLMGADMQSKSIQPYIFPCSQAFGEETSSYQVVQTAVYPLVQEVFNGRAATLLMFGQTGSGKTYTMKACQELVAAKLFEQSDIEVTLQCVELAGKRCRDLLDDTKEEAHITETREGSVQFGGASKVHVSTAEELQFLLDSANARRETQSTDKNDVSSRSHSVCQLRIRTADQKTSVLTLVDCAGTERRNDSLYHSSERQSESVGINASLYALKECFRARQQRHSHVPYRTSNLTRVLRESLERKEAKLVIIATVAPNATDTEHTIQTLKTVSDLVGSNCEESRHSKPSPKIATKSVACTSSTTLSDVTPTPPKKWSHQELVSWLHSKGLASRSPIPLDLDGRQVMRMSKIQLQTLFYHDKDSSKADKLFQSLRAESDRVARLDFKRRVASKSPCAVQHA